MKTLLDCKVERLFAQPKCAQCGSHKTRTYRCAELLEGVAALPYAPPHPGCRALVRFYCGATFSIDDLDHIVAAAPCSLATAHEADAMNIDADTDCELQEQAA